MHDAVAVVREGVVGLVAERIVEDVNAALLDGDRVGAAQIGSGKSGNEQQQRQQPQAEQQ